MSETSHDGSAVIGAAPTGSRETDHSLPPGRPPAEPPPGAAGPQLTGARPDGRTASWRRDITRALAELRRARRAAGGSTAPELSHDVDLAEWRLNRLLERTPAVT